MSTKQDSPLNVPPESNWRAVLPHLLLTAGAVVAATVMLGGFSWGVSLVIVALGAAGALPHLRASEAARRAVRGFEDLRSHLEASRAEGAASAGQMESLIQAMDGGVIILDEEQRVLSINHAAETMLGIVDRAARGRLLQEVVRQPDLHRFVTESAGSVREGVEFPLVGRPDRRIRASQRPLRDSEGRGVGLLIVLTDMTRLRRLESVRTDFAANVSHELRTPITNIKGYVETLQEMDFASDPDQTRQFLAIVARNADRLGAIVEDMLMLTQLERPDTRETLAVDHTRIAPILEAVQAALDAEAKKKSITVEHSAPDDLAAMVNQPLVEQAVTNLLGNAIRYSPVGTVVRMGAAARDGHVVISVADQGPGIAEEHLPRLFERFYRVDRARSREQGGTGLGLAIVKHIVNLHGGKVEVESEIGKGSTFRIHLPAS